ncbi:MAG: protein kinase [Polyangiaceae bacterium]|nr:protein kinase [Polyangiaceae bacterium]
MSDPSPGVQSAEHQVGDTLRDGRFAVTGRLGEGGQATTFDAIDKRDGRRVTLKQFRVRGASSWKEVELAEREAKVLAQIAHPNLPVYVDHFEERGNLYLVTEHIEGTTLAQLRERGPLSEAEVLRFLSDANAALQYLHERSPPLVHRDIKPSNVIARPDGSFAIIDFGAVRDRLKITGSTVVGTFGYMAPEQFQGRAMPASDVYAVGTTAVAMLSGVEPEDLPHKGLAIDVRAALPKVRPDLVSALASMVEPDPDRRASSIAPLLATLRKSPSKQAPPAAEREPVPSPFQTPPREESPPPGTTAADMQSAESDARSVATELGAAFVQMVEEAARGNVRDLRREVRRAAEIARREAKKASRVAQRGTREQATEARDRAREKVIEARRLRDALKRAERERDERRRQQNPGAPLGGPILLLVLLALGVAQLAVILALRVVTPVVLYIVSALFFGSIPGKAMRSAAGAVSDAGKRASEAIGRAKEVLRGKRVVADPHGATSVRVVQEPHVDPHAATHIGVVEKTSPPPQRVENLPTDPRNRIADEFQEVEDELAALEEQSEKGGRRR